MERSFEQLVYRKENALQHLTFHDGDLPYFSIPSFDALGILNAFTTKYGGISEGYYAELSMRVNQESPEIIQENYKRVAKTLGFDAERAVVSIQTHTTNIRTVTEEDCGKGPFRARDHEDVDGLITDIPGIPLVTQYADCVPLYFYDPVNRAIGLSHSGWKGTVHRMGSCTVRRMHEEFGTKAEDLITAIGPSICQDCYEVSADVADAFKTEFGAYRFSQMAYEKENGRFQLDLWKANETVMLEEGVLKEHIFVTDICTKCCSDLLYSHRVMGNQRGVMAAILSL